MKRRDLVKLLEDHDVLLLRAGSDHDLYWKSGLKRPVPIGRHREIEDDDAKEILKQAGITKKPAL